MIATQSFDWVAVMNGRQSFNTNTFLGGIPMNATTTAKRPTAKATAKGRAMTLQRRQVRAIKAGALTVTRSGRARTV